MEQKPQTRQEKLKTLTRTMVRTWYRIQLTHLNYKYYLWQTYGEPSFIPQIDYKTPSPTQKKLSDTPFRNNWTLAEATDFLLPILETKTTVYEED